MDIFSTHTRFLKKRGFTLIELLIVVAMIGILFVALTVLFDPLAQINKAQNSTRQQDLNQIKTALDTYFNDKGCYPTAIPFGQQWVSGSTVYMTKVPEDPSCSSSNVSYCYDYQTDGSACPQWNILYSTLHQPIASSIPTCLLSTSEACVPTSGLYTYNYCIVSGKLSCDYISSNPLPNPNLPPGDGSGDLGGGSNATPTTICNGQLSACSNGICNIEQANQCLGCGGSLQCYTGLTCGGTNCHR